MPRKAKGEGSLYEYRDGFRAYVTINGKRKYFYFPGMNKAQASAELRQLLNQRDDGILPKGKDYTLGLWMRHWLKTAKLKPAVLTNYEFNVEHYVVPNIGNIKLRQLEPEHLENFYELLLSGKLSKARSHGGGPKVKKPLSPRSVVNIHSNIRRALTVAMQRGHVGRNVAQLVDPPKAPKVEMRTFSATDAQAILAIAKTDRYHARWYLALVFGMRPAEVLGLTWPDIDLERGIIHVRRQLQDVRGKGTMLIESPKTSAGNRDIIIPENVVELFKKTRQQQLIDRIEHGENYVDWEFDGEPVALCFTQPNGKPLDKGVDTRVWKYMLDVAGLPHERRYIGRHTSASVMIDMGMDIAVVSSILGHSKTSFTYDTYVHPMADKKRSAAEQLGALYS